MNSWIHTYIHTYTHTHNTYTIYLMYMYDTYSMYHIVTYFMTHVFYTYIYIYIITTRYCRETVWFAGGDKRLNLALTILYLKIPVSACALVCL